MTQPYRTLFVGTLVQESFLSIGGRDLAEPTVDSPFCRDGLNRPTLRGTGLAGALIATLRRLHPNNIPTSISYSDEGRQPSVWRFFNAHPLTQHFAYRQNVKIADKTGAAAEGALFNTETLPPETYWPFLLEVDTSRETRAADLAREALSHWAAGRCLIGIDVARGMGWMRLENLHEYTIPIDRLGDWPNADQSENYPSYLENTFRSNPVFKATSALPGWLEITGTLSAGEREDGYGIDSLSVGGHASEELAAEWDGRFLAPDGLTETAAKALFDPDFAIATWKRGNARLPYIAGSSLRGPLRHALTRHLRAQGKPTKVVDSLFGTVKESAKLLIRDALLVEEHPLSLAWLQLHAEDEFTAGAYSSSKFDRVAVMQGQFAWKMVLEKPDKEEKEAFDTVLELARQGCIGIGGGQWRGHGWLRWDFANLPQRENNHV